MANFVRRVSSQGVDVRIEACGVEESDADFVKGMAYFMALVLTSPGPIKVAAGGALVGILEDIKRTLNLTKDI